MTQFFKIYSATIWFLNYFSGPNPFNASPVTNCKPLLYVPGILNIVQCVFILLYLEVREHVLASRDYSLTYHLLYSIADYVTYITLVLIRLTAARSSVHLSHTIRYLQSWRTDHGYGWRLSKASVLAVAYLLGSTAYTLFECVERLQFAATRTAGFIRKRYPMLSAAILVSTIATDNTAILFALSYVVVLG